MFVQPSFHQATLLSVQVGRKVIERLMVAAVTAISLTACGDSQSDSTLHQDLEKLTGQTLTSIEVVRYTDTIKLMCNFDRDILESVWLRLSPAELERQDYLFALYCPERLDLLVDIRPLTGTVDPDLIVPEQTPTPTSQPLRNSPTTFPR